MDFNFYSPNEKLLNFILEVRLNLIKTDKNESVNNLNPAHNDSSNTLYLVYSCLISHA